MELIKKPNQLSYGWSNEKYRTFLHLGKMKNAVVIHHSYINQHYFKIGVASFFPFTDEIYDKKYESLEEAKNEATKYILDWFSETNLALKNY
tara:strand:+ start:479 stop:754 length:276 start_codon:yes stop_codon:yes gene_type:complete